MSLRLHMWSCYADKFGIDANGGQITSSDIDVDRLNTMLEEFEIVIRAKPEALESVEDERPILAVLTGTAEVSTRSDLADARAHVQDAMWQKGTQCPCCDQLAKAYKRKLLGQMVSWLIKLSVYSGPDRNWINVEKVPTRGGDYAKLEYWDLIEHKANDDSLKKDSGFWRPTIQGHNFIFGRVHVASHVYVYDGKFLGFADTTVGIQDALGKKFNYRELMGPMLNEWRQV